MLENLAAAEWEKMQHYITGRLPLYSIKPNKNKRADVPTELRFEVDKKTASFVVSEVCEFAGVRLGARLLGYQVRARSNPNPNPNPSPNPNPARLPAARGQECAAGRRDRAH